MREGSTNNQCPCVIVFKVYHALSTLTKYSKLPSSELRKHLADFQAQTVERLQPDPRP